MKGFRFQNRLFLAYTGIIAALLAVQAVVLYFYVNDTIERSSRRDMQEISSRISQQIDFRLTEMNTISTGLLSSEEFRGILAAGRASTPIQLVEFRKRMEGILNTVNTPSFIADRILVFRSPDVFYGAGAPFADDPVLADRLERIPWAAELAANQGERLFLPTHPNDWTVAAEPCISLVRNVVDVEKRPYGAIEVQQDYSVLEELCGIDPAVGTVLVVTAQGETVYPYAEQESPGHRMQVDGFLARIAALDADSGDFRTDGADGPADIVAFSRSPYSGWNVLIVKPAIPAASTGTTLLLYFAGFFVAILLLVMGILMVTTRYLLRPIRQLTRSVADVSLDNLAISIDAAGSGNDEVAYLNDAFHRMFADLQRAIARQIEARNNEDRARFLALQSQMNPHFIYNTISMIESISYTTGNKAAAQLCTHFTSMLRYISDYSTENPTLAEEVAYAKDYIVLMKSRYEGVLEAVVEMDGDCGGLRVPRLILQPVVENSVEHGLFKVNPPWRIRVDVRRTGDSLALSVSDNGCGMDEAGIQRLEALFRENERRIGSSEGVGERTIGGLALANIHARMRLLFRERFSMSIRNAETGGLVVAMRIEDAFRDGEAG